MLCAWSRQSTVMTSLQSLPRYVRGVVRVHALPTTDTTAGGRGRVVWVTEDGRGPRCFRNVDTVVSQARRPCRTQQANPVVLKHGPNVRLTQ